MFRVDRYTGMTQHVRPTDDRMIKSITQHWSKVTK